MNRMNIIVNTLSAIIVYTTGFLIAFHFTETGGVSFQSYQNDLFYQLVK